MSPFPPPSRPLSIWHPPRKNDGGVEQISLLALRFFDAIRLNDTNAFVINILRGQPAAAAMAKEGPSPPTAAGSSTGHPASDAAPSNNQTTTAGSHLDGACLCMLLLGPFCNHGLLYVEPDGREPGHGIYTALALTAGLTVPEVKHLNAFFIFWRADTLPLRQYKWTLTTCISYLTTVIYLQVRITVAAAC